MLVHVCALIQLPSLSGVAQNCITALLQYPKPAWDLCLPNRGLGLCCHFNNWALMSLMDGPLWWSLQIISLIQETLRMRYHYLFNPRPPSLPDLNSVQNSPVSLPPWPIPITPDLPGQVSVADLWQGCRIPSCDRACKMVSDGALRMPPAAILQQQKTLLVLKIPPPKILIRSGCKMLALLC